MEDPTKAGGTGGTSSGGTGGGSPVDTTGGRGGRLPRGQAAKNAQTIYNTLRELGHTHEQASAALAHAEAESGFNPTARGDKGTSLGLWQWRDARDTKRRSAMLKWAKDNNLDWRDPKTQAQFFDWDLKHGEGKYAGPGYFQSRTTREAVTAMNNYERFRGWQRGQSQRYRAGEKYGRTMTPGGEIPKDDVTPPAMSGPGAEGDVRERQNRPGVTRRGALDPRLRAALNYASAQTGLIVDVTSGGQRMPGAPGHKGSHLHDRGRAADLNLIDPKTKTVLSPDDPRSVEFYRHAARAGVTGGSHSYMDDPNKIHLDIAGRPYRIGRTTREQFRVFSEAIARGRADLLKEGPIREARRGMDQSFNQNSLRTGNVKAEVDFGAMIKAEESKSSVFLPLKGVSSRMHKPVREGEVLFGDKDYSQSVP